MKHLILTALVLVSFNTFAVGMNSDISCESVVSQDRTTSTDKGSDKPAAAIADEGNTVDKD